jgi:hypothetical protein
MNFNWTNCFQKVSRTLRNSLHIITTTIAESYSNSVSFKGEFHISVHPFERKGSELQKLLEEGVCLGVLGLNGGLNESDESEEREYFKVPEEHEENEDAFT